MRGRRLLSALLAVFVVLVPAAGTGVAAPQPAAWTVTPGGPFGGWGGQMYGQPWQFVCSATELSGEFAASGTFLGTIDDAQYHDCTLWMASSVDIYYSTGPWTVWGVSQDLDLGLTTLTIEDITVDVAGVGCVATIAGSATALHTQSGRLYVTEHNTVATYVDPANDCLGLILEGDVVPVLSEEYVISPDQVFTVA